MPRVVSAWRAALALALLCLVGAFAPAQGNLVQLPAEHTAFVTRHWHSGTGLPQNTVNAVWQTRDGCLWLATLGGLCCFDGDRMRVFDPITAPELRSSRFTCLHEARDGTLWIGSDQGGLASLRNGDVRQHAELPVAVVRSIAEDGQGRLWVGTDEGLWCREQGVFQRVAGSGFDQVQVVWSRRDGTILVGSDRTLWSIVERVPRRLAEGDVRCFAEHGDRLLVGTPQGLCCLDGEQLVPWQPMPALAGVIMSLLFAGDGALWVGTEQRVHRIAPQAVPDASRFVAEAAFTRLVGAYDSQAARSLHEDREGGIWVGHTERGAVRYLPADVRSHGVRDGLPRRGLAAVAADGRGGLLVSTADGLFESAAGRFRAVPELAPFAPLRTLWVDADGTQWIVAAPGLLRRDAHGVELWGGLTPFRCDRIQALAGGASGGLWLGGQGVALLRGRDVVVPEVVEPLRQVTVRSLVLAADGALWIGGTGLLARVDPVRGTRRIWRCGEELPVGEVRSVLPEAGEQAWIATYGGGLVRIDGDRCQRIDESHGLVDQHLCGLLRHGEQFVVASNRGISVVPVADAEAVASGRAANLVCRLLGPPGGVPAEIDGGYQGCVAAANGALWFTGIETLYEFDPTRLRPPPSERPARVQYALAGAQRVVEPNELLVQPGDRSLYLRLVACAFDERAPSRFSWRVVGVHDAWSAPSYEREVRFDLPAGDFLFEAATVDIGGRRATTVCRLPIHVPRAWWEGAAVRLGAVLVVLVGGFALVRAGASRSARRAAVLQSLVDARTVELTTARQQLEQRVAERTADLRQALDRQVEEQRERERLERQVQQMQRMDSLGQLAGGIAHDFNNLLTVVRGAGELLADGVDASDRHELCRSIQFACERGRNLTQHLLAVASRQQVATSRLDLARVLVELRPVLQTLLGDGIGLSFEAPAEAVPVRAAVTQIEQVLLNLATNAREAMPAGGRFTVRIAVTGDACQLDVGDTGAGMPPEVLERAFEPFFSTRERGLGRGLGLATVYGIVKQLAGTVTITSRVGVGTQVHIVLPLDDGAATEPILVLPPPAARVGGRVLLVEDEPVVRATMERLLRRLGCDVVVAVDGADAVERLRAAPAAIDAVVSDVVMLGLHGRPLVDALRAVRADVPIVFVSGYLDGRFTHQELAEMGLEILAKPIDLPRLAATLRKAMAGVPGVAGA